MGKRGKGCSLLTLLVKLSGYEPRVRCARPPARVLRSTSGCLAGGWVRGWVGGDIGLLSLHAPSACSNAWPSLKAPEPSL